MALVLQGCVIFYFASFQTASLEIGPTFKSNVNLWADKFLHRLSNFMMSKGLDPHSLDNMEQNVYYFPGIKSVMHFTNGLVDNISEMKRDGDAGLSIGEHDRIIIQLPIIYDTINFKYHYDYLTLGFGPGGGMQGQISEPRIRIVALADPNSYEVRILSFDLIDSGRIKLMFKGHLIMDWLADFLTNSLSIVLQEKLTHFISDILEHEVSEYVGVINAYTKAHPEETARIVGKMKIYE